MSGTARRICFVTTTRADYGLLAEPMRAVRDCPDFQLQLLVGGTHLSDVFGGTVDLIRADGFAVDRELDYLEDDDSPAGTTAALGRFTAMAGSAIAELEPHLVVLLGDRWEILAPAQAALLFDVPVAHIAGGDVTGGALDDDVRDAVSQLSKLHFCTHAAAAERLAAMGLDRNRIHEVGSPGLDYARRCELLGRDELAASLGAPLASRVALVAYHRPTRRIARPWRDELQAILSALERLDDDWTFVVSGSNADPGAREVSERLEQFARSDSRAVWAVSAGQRVWLSAMKAADLVIGNSSAGLYEAPFLRTPTVNVGPRQDGRARAPSVIDVVGWADEIEDGIYTALERGRGDGTSPFGDGHASERILDVLRSIPDFSVLLNDSRTGGTE